MAIAKRSGAKKAKETKTTKSVKSLSLLPLIACFVFILWARVRRLGLARLFLLCSSGFAFSALVLVFRFDFLLDPGEFHV
jgi:hypothetical protein